MNKLYNLILKYEGKSNKSYLCPAKVWTCGIGFTTINGSPVTKDTYMTDAQIELEFWKQIKVFQEGIKHIIKQTLNENQLYALTSFAYNVGLGAFSKSTLLKKVSINPNDPTIAAEFAKWNKAGGKVLNGLVKRRKEEAELYFTKIV